VTLVTWPWTPHPAPYAGLATPVLGTLGRGCAGRPLERLESPLDV
jgi:hypothetical protein